MKRNQNPYPWVVGLGAGAAIFLYMRAKRKKDACFATVYGTQRGAMTRAGHSAVVAHEAATAAATEACK